MALINCTECAKQISDKANTCPGCGAPVTAQAQQFAQQSGMASGPAPGTPGDVSDPGDFSAELGPRAGKTKLFIGVGAAAAVVIGVVLFLAVGGSSKRLTTYQACGKLGMDECKETTESTTVARLGTASIMIESFGTSAAFKAGKEKASRVCESINSSSDESRCNVYVSASNLLIVSATTAARDEEGRNRLARAVPRL